jgi:1,4-dihydroxy-2-naphthoate octaprenyltransferase
MPDERPPADRSRLAIWLQASRPFSFTGSALPALFAGALAFWQDRDAAWWLLPPVVLAVVVLHAGVNLVSDYFDYRRGADRPGTLGSSGVILGNLLSPKRVLWAGVGCLTAAALAGVGFVLLRGLPLLVVGLAGLLGGGFYTTPPVELKYRALGDLAVFILFGPMIAIGAYLTLTGDYEHSVLLASLPLGCLIAAVLNANNLRDIEDDRAVGIRTLATVLGHRGAQAEYCVLVAGAYVLTAALVLVAALPPWSLLVLLTLPLAARNVAAVLGARPGESRKVATMDVQTAQLHLAFSVLYCLSLVLAAVFS